MRCTERGDALHSILRAPGPVLLCHRFGYFQLLPPIAAQPSVARTFMRFRSRSGNDRDPCPASKMPAVTFSRSAPVRCKVTNWSSGGADFGITVHCFNSQGRPVDSACLVGKGICVD